jgi:KDO2-lipid IV(A) lauroyltransferase
MLTNESFVRDILRLIIWYPFRWIILILPVPLGFYIMKLLGDLHYVCSKGKKNILKKNLTSIFDKTIDDHSYDLIIKRYLENHYIDHLHIFLYPKFTGRVIERYFHIEGIENLDKELSKGRGCILLQGHFGPVQIPLFVLALKGYNIKQVGYLWRPDNLSYIGEKVAFRLRDRYESMIPAEIISAKSFLKSAFILLKENGIIMMNGDGAAGRQFIGRHIPVSFFGKKALFPVGSIDLARRTGAPILPLFILRESPWKYRIVVETPLDLDSISDDLDLEKGVEKFVMRFKYYVKRYPCHWHLWDEWDTRLYKDSDKEEGN